MGRLAYKEGGEAREGGKASVIGKVEKLVKGKVGRLA